MALFLQIPAWIYSAVFASFLTWLLNQFNRGRRIKDEFGIAILDCLKTFAERSDNMDTEAFLAYRKSVRLLRPYAEYFRINHRLWWQWRVAKAWKNYSEPDEGARYENFVAAGTTPAKWQGALILLLSAVRG